MGVEEIESVKNVERIVIFFLLLLLAIPAYVQEYSVHKYHVENTPQPWPSEQCNNITRGKIVFTYHGGYDRLYICAYNHHTSKTPNAAKNYRWTALTNGTGHPK